MFIVSLKRLFRFYLRQIWTLVYRQNIEIEDKEESEKYSLYTQ